MLFLIQQRANKLSKKANEEIEAIERANDENGISPISAEDKEFKERQRKEINNMFLRVKAPSKNDARNEDYQVKPDTFNLNKQYAVISPSADSGDVEMSGMDNPPKLRTAKAVRDELNRNMKELVDRGTQELEGYDAHAQASLQHYRQALERRTGRPAPPLQPGYPGSAVPPKGILKNSSDGTSASRSERRASGIKFSLP